MHCEPEESTVGVMLSGGLDSSILLGHFLRKGRCVRPFYVQSGLVWQTVEAAVVGRYLHRLQESFPQLLPLVVLDLPLADLYDGHWSLTGITPPDAESADEAVYLPGRNALLLLKASLWCQMHGVPQLAIGVLGTSPFADATSEFFETFQAMVNRGTDSPLQILRPLAGLTKCQVMQLGEGLPLGLTFSCIAPVDGLHCGRCNKCAERQAAFRLVHWPDSTPYAHMPPKAPIDRQATSTSSPQESTPCSS
jgi:7-cyano-7-deazaguanine synthase